MKKILLLAFCFLFFLVVPRVFADEGWVVEGFESNITIQKTGTVHVEETISVDFKGLEKHGIYRDIPYRYTERDGSKVYSEIKKILTGNDQKEVSTQGDFKRIRIGDPNKTLSGKKTYQISYDAIGVLRGFDKYDELYWNVTGNSWPVVINYALARVQIEGAAVQDVKCFRGQQGSNTLCFNEINKGKAVFGNWYTELQPSEGLTIVATYPKGIIALPVVKSFTEKFFEIPSLAFVLFVSLLGIGIVIFLWFKNGRDFWWRQKQLFDPAAKEEVKPLGTKETIVVEYEPPEKLRPAELGVLMDERADTLDVTSTIIDLATRGYLTIQEERKKWLFGSVDYTLARQKKDASELLSYEKELLDRLFDSGDVVKVSSLKTKFYTDLKKVKDLLYEEVVDKKLFPQNPESVRGKYLAIAIGIVILSGLVVFNSIKFQWLFPSDVGLAGVITGVVALATSFFMPRRSSYGHELYRRVKGYQLFISHVEKYRQQFFEKKNMFNEVLPYAIVFGLTEKFAKAMADLGVKPNRTGWYYGTSPFNTVSFGKNISSFSNSFSSAIASTPSKNGGFSGGSSGGGFGGGGGGSW